MRNQFKIIYDAPTSLNLLLWAVIIAALMFVTAAVMADSQHDSSDIIINLPDSGGTNCAAARAHAGGQHQYFKTTGGQMSIAYAYDDCSAMSVGTAVRSSSNSLITGELSCDENGDCAGGAAYLIKFK